jgi:hypothetical protein
MNTRPNSHEFSYDYCRMVTLAVVRQESKSREFGIIHYVALHQTLNDSDSSAVS